jgi:hypothetical protein
MIMAKISSFCLIFLSLLQGSALGSVRVLVRYREDSFIAEALDLSLDGRLVANITSRRILSIQVRDNAVLQRIQDSANVEIAELDELYFPLVFGGFRNKDIEIDFEVGDVLDRDWEVIPYGVPMVQADQVWEIPEVEEDLAVCVVDTGIDVFHRVRGY